MADPPPDLRPAVAPIPAATVVPLRDGPSGLEVLMLRRNSRGQFGGMWVFPGGQVDPSDMVESGTEVDRSGMVESGTEVDRSGMVESGTEVDPSGTAESGSEISAARRAAVREAIEEAALRLDEDRLVVHSFWLPPPESPRRFATWFFLAPVDEAAAIMVDLVEIHEHRWFRPEDAMAARNAGEIELAPPTYMTLWWLSRQADTRAALGAAAAQPAERFETHIAPGRDDEPMATLWAGDAGYEDLDASRPGRRRRLIMDPAGWRVEIDL